MTTCCSSTATAMMEPTGQGVYGRDPDTEEPDDAKVSSAQQSLWEVRFGSGGGLGDCPADHNLGRTLPFVPATERE
ncbi:MAG: hypothetical protein ABIG63_19590 [Chloroflexota bacterium]